MEPTPACPRQPEVTKSAQCFYVWNSCSQLSQRLSEQRVRVKTSSGGLSHVIPDTQAPGSEGKPLYGGHQSTSKHLPQHCHGGGCGQATQVAQERLWLQPKAQSHCSSSVWVSAPKSAQGYPRPAAVVLEHEKLLLQN